VGTCWRLSPLVAVVAIVFHLSIWSHAEPTPGPTLAGGLGGTVGAIVAQFFAWMFLLLAISLVWSLISAVLAEFRLRRMYDRVDRKWVRLPGYRSVRGPHGTHAGPGHDTMAGHDPLAGPGASGSFTGPLTGSMTPGAFLGAGGRFRRATPEPAPSATTPPAAPPPGPVPLPSSPVPGPPFGEPDTPA
jgi:hypothetical protein